MEYEMKESELRAWSYWSNRFVYNPREKEATIYSCRAAADRDWPINQLLLIHGLELMLKGWRVDVLLFEEDLDDPVGSRGSFSVAELAKLLQYIPNEGKDVDHGPYYWINRTGDYVPLKNQAA